MNGKKKFAGAEFRPMGKLRPVWASPLDSGKRFSKFEIEPQHMNR
jgi:hypothetical protein